MNTELIELCKNALRQGLSLCICRGRGFTVNRGIAEYEKEPCDECFRIRKALEAIEKQKNKP